MAMRFKEFLSYLHKFPLEIIRDRMSPPCETVTPRSGTAPVALAFHLFGFNHVNADAAPSPDLVLCEFAVNDDFWGWMEMKQTCGGSSAPIPPARDNCTMLDSLFTESFVRNFRSLGSAVAYVRFGYSFINNDVGELVS